MSEKSDILYKVADEWDAEYDRLTFEHGSYKQIKVRAAYRLGAILLRQRAHEEETAE